MSSPQIRIAFNADLVRQASLQNVRYLAIDLDDERLTFISTRSPEYEGVLAFRLIRDGGQSSSKTASKALFLHKEYLSKLHLQARRYEPEFERGRISISLEPAYTSYPDASKIPSRLGGVYRIRDACGTDIDIGCSKNDVRSRVSTKWEHEKEAALVLVYELKSEPDCLHWERVFQKEFVRRYGKLPRYCQLMGTGCGCTACG